MRSDSTVELLAAQDGQLRLDGLLMPSQEWFVMPAGHPDEFSPGNTGHRIGGRLRQRRLILIADEDEDEQ